MIPTPYLAAVAIVSCFAAVWFAAQFMTFLQFRMRLSNGLSVELFKAPASRCKSLGEEPGLLLLTAAFTIFGFYTSSKIETDFRNFLQILTGLVLLATFVSCAYFVVCKQRVLRSWQRSDDEQARAEPVYAAPRKDLMDILFGLFTIAWFWFPSLCMTIFFGFLAYGGAQELFHVQFVSYLAAALGVALGGLLTYAGYLKNFA